VRVGIVVNPVAGRAGLGGGAGRALAVLSRRMGQAGVEFWRRYTQRAGDAATWAQESCERGDRALVIVGGDGTIREAVDGMVGEGVPILVVPCGTENILARFFGIKADGDWLWQVLEAGKTYRVDVGAVRCAVSQERPGGLRSQSFLLMVGVGFDAEVARRLALARGGLMRQGGHISYWTYVWPVWRALWDHRPREIEVEVDGERLCSGPASVMVGNVPRYALGLRPFARARCDDGLLDVCVFEYRWRTGQVWYIPRVLLQRHVGSRGIIHRQGRSVRIKAEGPVPVQTDGDFAGWLPVEATLSGRSARFLVAAGFEPSATRQDR
jgi:diacylglycerol kinase family enzyme